MKKVKKVFWILIFLLLFNIVSPVLADDIDDEFEDINLDSLQASTVSTDVPSLNSRAAVIYDRTSKKIIYGKNEFTRRPMASTTNVVTS